MSRNFYLPPKHHVPILEDPINFYYIPVFKSFFIARLKATLSFADNEALGSVLDIGCGTGALFPELKRRGGDYLVGIDTFVQEYSFKGLMKKEDVAADIAWADAQYLPFKDDSFDTVVCISALEHIEDSKGTLEEIKRIIKPGGRFLGGVPTQNIITDKLLGESTGFHVSGHRKILNAAKQVFGIIREKHIPGFVPLNLSLYVAFEGRKDY